MCPRGHRTTRRPQVSITSRTPLLPPRLLARAAARPRPWARAGLGGSGQAGSALGSFGRHRGTEGPRLPTSPPRCHPASVQPSRELGLAQPCPCCSPSPHRRDQVGTGFLCQVEQSQVEAVTQETEQGHPRGCSSMPATRGSPKPSTPGDRAGTAPRGAPLSESGSAPERGHPPFPHSPSPSPTHAHQHPQGAQSCRGAPPAPCPRPVTPTPAPPGPHLQSHPVSHRDVSPGVVTSRPFVPDTCQPKPRSSPVRCHPFPRRSLRLTGLPVRAEPAEPPRPASPGAARPRPAPPRYPPRPGTLPPPPGCPTRAATGRPGKKIPSLGFGGNTPQRVPGGGSSLWSVPRLRCHRIPAPRPQTGSRPLTKTAPRHPHPRGLTCWAVKI